MVIFITGGLGFVGSFVARGFLKEGYDVVLMDTVLNKDLVKDIEDKVFLVKGDVTNYVQLVKTLKKNKPDVIIHCAALLSAITESNPTLGYKVNFQGTWNTYEAARVADVEAILFASSIAVYGQEAPESVKEDVYTMPQSLYGISKNLGELLGLWFYKKYGIQFAALRYASIIGPGRKDGGASAYSTLIIQKAAQGEPYEVNVPGDTIIPIVYIKDAVDATVTVYRKIKELKTRIYNVASLIPSPKAIEIVNAVKKVIPDAKITFKPEPTITAIIESWPKNVVIDRIIEEAKWFPKYNKLEVIVSDFIDEVKQSSGVHFIS